MNGRGRNCGFELDEVKDQRRKNGRGRNCGFELDEVKDWRRMTEEGEIVVLN